MPARAHEGHAGEVIELVRLHCLKDADNRSLIRQVRAVQLQLPLKLLKARAVTAAAAPEHSSHSIAFAQKQLRQVRTVLARDTRDERGWHSILRALRTPQNRDLLIIPSGREQWNATLLEKSRVALGG